MRVYDCVRSRELSVVRSGKWQFSKQIYFSVPCRGEAGDRHGLQPKPQSCTNLSAPGRSQWPHRPKRSLGFSFNSAIAEAKPTAPTASQRSRVSPSNSVIAKAKPMVPTASQRSLGFPGRPVRDARSAEWERMSPLSLTLNVRGHRFQMHHYRNCAGDPLKN